MISAYFWGRKEIIVKMISLFLKLSGKTWQLLKALIFLNKQEKWALWLLNSFIWWLEVLNQFNDWYPNQLRLIKFVLWPIMQHPSGCDGLAYLKLGDPTWSGWPPGAPPQVSYSGHTPFRWAWAPATSSSPNASCAAQPTPEISQIATCVLIIFTALSSFWNLWLAPFAPANQTASVTFGVPSGN